MQMWFCLLFKELEVVSSQPRTDLLAPAFLLPFAIFIPKQPIFKKPNPSAPFNWLPSVAGFVLSFVIHIVAAWVGFVITAVNIA